MMLKNGIVDSKFAKGTIKYLVQAKEKQIIENIIKSLFTKSNEKMYDILSRSRIYTKKGDF